MKSFISVLLIISGLFTFSIADDFIVDSMVGHWRGKGKIIVSWCEQDSLPVDIWVGKDGSVNGTIGDAEILSGMLKKNSALLRLLGNRNYIVDLKLRGHLVDDEEIQRSGGKLLLDFENAVFTGGFHSSGSKFGGKEKMVMTVVSFEFKKTTDADWE